jgi:predicted phage terminase large subunit-like protein
MTRKAPNAEEKRRLAEIAEVEAQMLAAQRLIRVKKARETLLDFTAMTMPDPEFPDDAEKSRYQPVRHHETICAALEQVEKGAWQRLIISMPPRHGKSELASRRFPAWFLGKDPYRQVIFATYNEDLAMDFGRSVREIMRSPSFKQVFPGCKLRQGEQSAERIKTDEGGVANFVGVGGGLTGRGADLLVIDDPIKGVQEAESKRERDKLWDWFTNVAMTRLMTAARVVIIMTRWHEDDLVGRLTDPRNPCYDDEVAQQWRILSLPAIADDNDPMGRAKGEALWPERYPLEYLNEIRRLNGKGFSALYQGKPTPDDGDFFERKWLKTYSPEMLPKNLRVYVASDHAVSTAQTADKTCLIPVGVDEEDNIWILPDVWWRRADTDDVVDAMVDLMQRHNPSIWWAEKGHISKSIGPFLRKIQQERGVYTVVEEVTPAKDKQTRAQAIRGRMAMGKVYFPKFSPWWQDAQDELLKFPSARHDDFVDALAHIGMGLSRQVAANGPVVKVPDQPKPGTLAWVKWATKAEDARRMFLRMGGF